MPLSSGLFELSMLINLGFPILAFCISFAESDRRLSSSSAIFCVALDGADGFSSIMSTSGMGSFCVLLRERRCRIKRATIPTIKKPPMAAPTPIPALAPVDMFNDGTAVCVMYTVGTKVEIFVVFEYSDVIELEDLDTEVV